MAELEQRELIKEIDKSEVIMPSFTVIYTLFSTICHIMTTILICIMLIFQEKIMKAIIPKDEADENDAILEVRAGTINVHVFLSYESLNEFGLLYLS